MLVPKIQGDAVELHPAAGHVRDRHRRRAGRPARGDPRAARSRPPCATSSATCSDGSARTTPRGPRRVDRRARAGASIRASRAGRRRERPDRRPVQDPPGRPGGRGRGHQRRLPTARAQVPPRRRRRAEAAARMAAINAAWELIGEPAARAAFDRRARARGGDGRRATAGRTRRPTGAQAAAPGPAEIPAPAPRPPETVSRDWTSGRSSIGGGYDAVDATARRHGRGRPAARATRRAACSTSGAMPAGRSARSRARDLEYLEWLDRMPIGRPYRDEIDAILRRTGRRRSAAAEAADRRGLFRRR